eukprot:tig00000718_g3697.t1
MTSSGLSLQGSSILSKTMGASARASQHEILSATLQRSRAVEADSAVLRSQTDRLVSQLERGMVNLHVQNNELLRDQIKETANAKAELTNRLVRLNAEIVRLERAKRLVHDAIIQKNLPTSVTNTCINHRSVRPDAPVTGFDDVDVGLDGEYGRLLRMQNNLSETARRIQGDIERLLKVRSELEREIRDKEVALRLDRECLRLRHANDRPGKGFKPRVGPN